MLLRCAKVHQLGCKLEHLATSVLVTEGTVDAGFLAIHEILSSDTRQDRIDCQEDGRLGPFFWCLPEEAGKVKQNRQDSRGVLCDIRVHRSGV